MYQKSTSVLASKVSSATSKGSTTITIPQNTVSNIETQLAQIKPSEVISTIPIKQTTRTRIPEPPRFANRFEGTKPSGKIDNLMDLGNIEGLGVMSSGRFASTSLTKTKSKTTQISQKKTKLKDVSSLLIDTSTKQEQLSKQKQEQKQKQKLLQKQMQRQRLKQQYDFLQISDFAKVTSPKKPKPPKKPTYAFFDLPERKIKKGKKKKDRGKKKERLFSLMPTAYERAVGIKAKKLTKEQIKRRLARHKGFSVTRLA